MDLKPQAPIKPGNEGWRRPLAYLLLLAGVLATFFNNDIGHGLNISTVIVQFIALGLLLVGAALFYSVRRTPDRLTDYRQAFRPVDLPQEVKPANQTDAFEEEQNGERKP